MKKFIILSILTFALFALTACGGASDHYEGLIGTWHWNADGAYTYTFNYDGTGERGFPETNQTFTWATNGDRLEISRDYALRREIQNETWTFEIYEYTLTMHSNNQQYLYFIYEREITEHPEEMLGQWAWDSDPLYIYTFNYDGTGTRGRIGTSESFTWAADETRLNIIRDAAPSDIIRGEMWFFEIYEDILTLTSRQEEYLSPLNYTRVQ